MSKEFDSNRRQFIGLGALCGIGLLVSRSVIADELTDLITRPNSDNELIAVRLWPSSIYTRLTLEAENSIVAKTEVLDNPLRLVVSISDITLNKVLKNLSTKVLKEDPIIGGIEVESDSNSDSVKIVIALKQHIQVQTQVITQIKPGSVNYKYRIVFSYISKDTVSLLSVGDHDVYKK